MTGRMKTVKAELAIEQDGGTLIDLRANRPLQLLLGWYLVFWVAMAISPLDRSDWLLENLLVFVAAGFLAATYRSFPLSNFSYLLIRSL
jgi:uncharacterized membrane protein YjdF